MSSAPTSRIPPHNLEAERSVLGAILLHNQVLDSIRDVGGLEPNDFYRESHARVFEGALALEERREAIDLITMTNWLKTKGYLDQVGGPPALAGLIEDPFAVSNVGHYAKIVRNKSILRKMIQTCVNAVEEAYQGVDDLEGYLDRVETEILRVSESNDQKSFANLKSIIRSNIEHIELLTQSKKEVNGLPTGFRDFDRLTTGLYPGQVVVIAARPGMGKTSWFLSALQHAALKESAVVALFSLEMSKEELGIRFLSQVSKLDSKDLKLGRLASPEWKRLTDAAGLLSQSKIYVDDQAGVSVMDVRARCRRLLNTEKKLDLIIIDYLQIMSAGKGNRALDLNMHLKISEISRSVKELAKELKVPIIILSQLSREVEKNQDKRPTLSHLKESGSIEQDADMVCFIYRDEYYNKNSDERGIAEFIIAKNRSGPTDTIRLAWLGQYTLFENLSGPSGAQALQYFEPPDHRSPPRADNHTPSPRPIGAPPDLGNRNDPPKRHLRPVEPVRPEPSTPRPSAPSSDSPDDDLPWI